MRPQSRVATSLPPSKLRERKRRQVVVITSILGVLLVLLAGGIIGLLHIKALLVRDVVVEGTQVLAPSAIEAVVRTELSGTYAYLIPKNNAFIYSDAAISAALLAAFPKLKEAKVSLENFHTVKATVVERVPVALWCGESLAESVCYFMDEDGVVYDSAPDFSGTPYVRWYGSVDRNDRDTQYLTKEHFRALHPLVLTLEKEAVTPVTVLVDQHKDVYVSFREGGELRFTLEQPAEKVIQHLHLAFGTEALMEKKLSDLQYLDLRFEKKIYFK